MPSPHPKHHVPGGPRLDAALASAVDALERTGVDVPHQGAAINVTALVRLALLVAPSVPPSAWAEVEKPPSEKSQRGTTQLLIGSPLLDLAIAGAHEARQRAGRPPVKLGALIRFALLAVRHAPAEAVRIAASRDQDEALKRLLEGPADAEALRRASASLAAHGVGAEEVGRVVRVALVMAARAPAEQAREGVVVEHALTQATSRRRER